MQDVKFDAILFTEMLNIRTVSLIRNIIHDDMRCLHLDMWLIDTGTLSQQADQFQRILSTTQSNQNAITIFQKMIIHTTFIKLF